jgi:UDP-N-acetylglucosamine--N-acetylmuramyl-(pentapeptide) pyrophosphoryl-undecaprenol N-acetylglucosamine transferase
MRVLICGGGTGGHIYPALAAVSELEGMGVTAEQVLWIGTRGQLEESLVPRAGLRLETIQGGAVAGVPLQVQAVNLARLAWSVGKANGIIGRFRPNVLFMTGGYVNVPVALAAWLRRVPGAIYLPDVEPGKAIRFLSRLVKKVACTTEMSKAYLPAEKLVVTGYPVRPEIRAANELSKAEALARFELAAERPTLFVFGGSRGARSINRGVMAALPELLKWIQVIHVSGTLDWPEVEKGAAALADELRVYYRPYAYLHEEMGPAFRAADLVVARAGASMLGECPAFGLPAVLVPYPHAWRYQKVNADYLAERGAAVRLDDEKLGTELRPLVSDLLKDEKRLAAMAAAAKALDVPDAAGRLAHLIVQLGQDGDR